MSAETESLLSKAKDCIASGESSVREAAEYIAQAMRLDNKLTQRAVAARLGKSAAWVNGLIRWKFDGYKSETAFGPQNAQKRAKAAAFSQTKHEKPTTKEEAEAKKAKAHASEARARADEAKAKARKATEDRKRAEADAARAAFGVLGGGGKKANIFAGQRERLLKFLGMLGSDQDGERATAAKMADEFRKKLNLTWDDLIVEAAR